QRVRDRDEDEGGQEDTERRHHRAGEATNDVTDEGRRREDRTRRELADGHRVEQLRFGKPAEALDEIVVDKGDEDIAGAVEHAADLEEGEEEAEASVGDGRVG